MSNEKEVFAKKLNYYMDKHGKTQTDLINDLNINKSTISTWCSGTKMPRMGTIQTLADYFGIMKSDLIEEKTDAPYIIYKRGKFQPLRLKQYRLRVQDNPEVVASNLGVSKHSYLGWEDGSIKMFVEQIEEVADYFGISTDYLYGYTDDPKAGMKKYDVLSFEEQRIGRLYGRADADTRKAVELMLKRFDDEDKESEETVHIFRAARSENNAAPEIRDMSPERAKELEEAEETDEI